MGGWDYLHSEQGPVADYFKHGTGPPAFIEGDVTAGLSGTRYRAS